MDESIKVGDKLAIYCYKHDGTLEHTSDEAIVLENNEDVLICGNGRTRITEKDGRSHMTNEPAVLFFYIQAEKPHQTPVSLRLSWSC